MPRRFARNYLSGAKWCGGPTSSSTNRALTLSYLLDNAAEESPIRLDNLGLVFDANTRAHLDTRGLGEGWHCLEVGAGSGSIARWLSDRVGPTGHVVATDLDPRMLGHLAAPNIEIRRHDVAHDTLEEGAFDLVHARLVLEHVPTREHALAVMVKALKPGGWIVIEDFDASVRPDPDQYEGERRLLSHVAMIAVMHERGIDPHFIRQVPALLQAAGLVECGGAGFAHLHDRQSPWRQVLHANIQQLRAPIIATGLVSATQLDTELASLARDDYLLPSSLLWTMWGRRAIDR